MREDLPIYKKYLGPAKVQFCERKGKIGNLSRKSYQNTTLEKPTDLSFSKDNIVIQICTVK
jgi:hypothetical protein